MQKHIINKIWGDKDHHTCTCGWEGETKDIPQHMVRNQFLVNLKKEDEEK